MNRPQAALAAAPPHDLPDGWQYNPSAWGQRLPIAALALAGFGIALYLALFQWGVIAAVWDPWFGRGSERVLTSGVSRAFPVSDAFLGALGYVADAVSAVVGGRSRWRTMPWIVIVFGIAVGPLGAISILLVILQPLAAGAWCTLCIASAVISIVMIPPSMDEVLASLQVLRRERDAGRSAWKALWHGVDR